MDFKFTGWPSLCALAVSFLSGSGFAAEQHCSFVQRAMGTAKPTNEQIITAARAVADRYEAPTSVELKNARHTLYRIMNDVQRRLKNESKFKQWADKFAWNEAVGEFAKENDKDIDLSKFDTMRAVLFTDYVNEQDWPPFTSMRQALEVWVGFISVVQLATPEQVHSDYMTNLVDALADTESSVNQARISESIDWLDISGQKNTVYHAVNCRFSNHNLRIVASENFLEAILTSDMKERVAETQRVAEWKDGAYISGTSTTSGTLTLDVVSNPNKAQIDFVFNGKVDTHVSATASRRGLFRTRSWSVPVSLYTNVQSRKSIQIDDEGLKPSRAYGSANTSSAVSNRVSSNSRIGNNTALNRVRASQPQARGETSNEVVSQVASRLDRDAKEPISRAQVGFVEDFKMPFTRKNAGPARLDYHSSNNEIFIDVLMKEKRQLGAGTRVPHVDYRNHDVTFVVHESFATNFSSVFQSGETLSHKDIAIRMADFLGEVPRELDTNSPLAKPWSITLAEYGGVAFDFSETEMSICYKITDFEYRRKSQGAAIDLCGRYAYEYSDNNIYFTRTGDVELTFVGEVEDSAKAFVTKKLKAMYLEDFKWDNGIELPGEWSKAGALTLKDFGVRDGWLWFAYVRDQS